jgi:hypothetical protein
MGMKNSSIQLAVELNMNGVFDSVKNIIDMGTQEIRINYEQLKNLYQNAGLEFDESKYEILKNFPKGDRLPTSFIWEDIGIHNYTCLDINKTNDSVFVDLNLPFDDIEHLEKYDLVTDFGNNEHVFNVGEAYKTMYKLCKVNGYIWIKQSVYNGNGFFNYDISFFEGMAAANRLGVVYSAYVVKTNTYDEYLIPCNKNLFNALDLNKIKGVDITYVYKKNYNDDFKYYYQYGLDEQTRKYSLQFLTSNYPPERYYIPTNNIEEYKEMASNGDKEAIQWLRSIGIHKF